LLLVVVLFACSEEGGNPMKIAPEALLAELQEAVRNPGGKCRLDSNESETDKRIERLLRATAADVVSIEKPAYVVEPAIELLIRAPEPQAPLLSVLVYLQDDHCERFHLADMWEEEKPLP
jgi:hypothetical protein